VLRGCGELTFVDRIAAKDVLETGSQIDVAGTYGRRLPFAAQLLGKCMIAVEHRSPRHCMVRPRYAPVVADGSGKSRRRTDVGE
jgi:hypothetical protein